MARRVRVSRLPLEGIPTAVESMIVLGIPVALSQGPGTHGPEHCCHDPGHDKR
jgi:hypothetical protein